MPEVVYRNALAVELRLRGLTVRSESKSEVWYKGERVGTFSIDLLVNDTVIVEIKAASQLISVHIRQLFSYLRASNKEVGLVLNFGPQAEYDRIVNPAFTPSTQSD